MPLKIILLQLRTFDSKPETNKKKKEEEEDIESKL